MKNKRSQKFICLILMVVMILPLIFACDGAVDGDKTTVVCVDFYEYDWARNVLGKNPGGLELVLLNDTGTDMHSFQPTVKDMATLYRADLLIFTDGLSEFWIDEAIGSYENINSLSLMEVFMHEGLSEGYVLDDDDEDEHKHEHEHVHEHGHEGHHHEADEHLYLSLKLAEKFVQNIAEELSLLDAENKEYYLSNAAKYIESLDALDKEYEEVLSRGCFVLIADRFPFTYLFQDYGIEHEEAFRGCSTDVDCKFETVVRLAKIIRERGLGEIVILEGSKTNLANSIIQASGMKPEILILDSMQSISEGELKDGITYISVMKNNLEVFKKLCRN